MASRIKALLGGSPPVKDEEGTAGSPTENPPNDAAKFVLAALAQASRSFARTEDTAPEVAEQNEKNLTFASTQILRLRVDIASF